MNYLNNNLNPFIYLYSLIERLIRMFKKNIFSPMIAMFLGVEKKVAALCIRQTKIWLLWPNCTREPDIDQGLQAEVNEVQVQPGN